MRNLAMFLVLSSTVVTAVACRDDEEPAAKPRSMAATPVPRRVPQIAPPIDVTAPPSDATKTASGVSYKRLVVNNLGAQVKGNETALVRYTGWRQGTGETFATTTGAEHPIAIDAAHAGPGFREALGLLHQGEKMMVWLPAEDRGAEAVAYEIELVGVSPEQIATAPTGLRPVAPVPMASQLRSGER